MSNRTFACRVCRTLQRRSQNLPSPRCSHCGGTTVCVHWKLHVPSPRKRRKWETFWRQYLLELRLIEEFKAGIGPDELSLSLLNQLWIRAPRPT